METKDYFIKDEGEFFTLGLNSKKAKNLFWVQSDNHKLTSYYDGDVLKANILNEFKPLVIAWLVSHNLRGEEF